MSSHTTTADTATIRQDWQRTTRRPLTVTVPGHDGISGQQVTFTNPHLPHALIEVTFYTPASKGRGRLDNGVRIYQQITVVHHDPVTGAVEWSDTETWPSGKRFWTRMAARAAVSTEARNANPANYPWSGSRDAQTRWVD